VCNATPSKGGAVGDSTVIVFGEADPLFELKGGTIAAAIR
jgi:hypothetical protein